MARGNPRSQQQTEGEHIVQDSVNEAHVEGNVNAAGAAGAGAGDPLANVDTSNMTAAQRLAHEHALANPKKTKAAKPEGEATERQKIMVNDPENGQPIARQDLIKRLWANEKLSRSQITAVLNDPKVNTSGKKIPYQIVFAATKGVAGGPENPTSAASSLKGAGGQGETATEGQAQGQ
jgi:hypothetical protein